MTLKFDCHSIHVILHHIGIILQPYLNVLSSPYFPLHYWSFPYGCGLSAHHHHPGERHYVLYEIIGLKLIIVCVTMSACVSLLRYWRWLAYDLITLIRFGDYYSAYNRWMCMPCHRWYAERKEKTLLCLYSHLKERINNS